MISLFHISPPSALGSNYPYGTSFLQSSVKPPLIALTDQGKRPNTTTTLPSKPYLDGPNYQLEWPHVPLEAAGSRTFTIIVRVTSDATPGTLLKWHAHMYQNVAPGFPYW